MDVRSAMVWGMVLVTGCPAPVTTVTSRDGVVTLEVPAAALSEDVAIQVTPTTTALEGVVEGFAYQFEPSGLQFEEPVTLSFDVSALSPAVAEGELEVVLVTELYDPKGMLVEGVQHFDTTLSDGVLTTRIDHFSTYAVGFAMPRNASYDRATWLAASESTVATWDFVPQAVECVPRCDPAQWNRTFYFAFERAHDPSASVAAPRPGGLRYGFAGTVDVRDERFEVAGNPNYPGDTTLFLRSIQSAFYGSTLHARQAFDWNPVRAFGPGGGSGTTVTTPTAGSVCRLGQEEFELRLTNETITCASGSCPTTSLVDLEVDWLTADPAGFDARIPVRIVRQAPAAAPADPLLDARFAGAGTVDRTFTVTINTGVGSTQIAVPSAALDADGTPGPWVYTVEYGVDMPVAPADNEIRVNGSPPRQLDPSPCNATAPEITVTIN